MTKDTIDNSNIGEEIKAEAKPEIKKKVAKVKKTITVRNNMRCRWRVPPQMAADISVNSMKDLKRKKEIIGSLRKTLHPNETFTIDRDSFNSYFKGCKAFRAMIDLKHITTDLTEVPNAMLTSVKPPEPPEILKHPDMDAKMMVKKGNVNPMNLMKGMM